MSRRKHVLLSMLIVSIDPLKETEKHITDDKVVQSNINLFSVDCDKHRLLVHNYGYTKHLAQNCRTMNIEQAFAEKGI